ncbi:MAG: hypothetical protein ACT4NL_11680 [Pseudomarimonas sp.]
MYSPCAWNALLRALDLVGWVVAGRPVRLRLLTASIELASRKPARIEFLGFRTPAEVQTILADCHLCYMPQPFRPHLRDLCRYSFPTKLSNYLDVGRPVLVHSPPEGALSEFYARHPIGVHANSQEPAEIIAALEALLADTNAYQRACEQVAEVAQAHFSQAVFHAAIDHLLGRRQVPQGPIASSQVPPP